MLKVRTMQIDEEQAWFCDLLRRENVKSYLEIGCYRGGSLQRVAVSLQAGSRVVGVELPEPPPLYPKQSRPVIQQVIDELIDAGYDAQMIWGHSQSPHAISAARRLGPFDCVFIDGDHRLSGVTADWLNYGPMGRLVAFHDIGYSRTAHGEIDSFHNQHVPEFWKTIRERYRHEEIALSTVAGIGVLWR